MVALGDTWVAVATDKNYIRLFSLGGTQREIISIPGGQVVTLSGRDQLIIVYQELPSEWLYLFMHLSNIHALHVCLFVFNFYYFLIFRVIIECLGIRCWTEKRSVSSTPATTDS